MNFEEDLSPPEAIQVIIGFAKAHLADLRLEHGTAGTIYVSAGVICLIVAMYCLVSPSTTLALAILAIPPIAGTLRTNIGEKEKVYWATVSMLLILGVALGLRKDEKQYYQDQQALNRSFESIGQGIQSNMTMNQNQFKQTLAEFSNTNSGIGNVSKQVTVVTGSIAKIAIPYAPSPELPTLELRLLNKNSAVPLDALFPDEDSVVSFDFYVKNTSHAYITAGEFWIYICEDCRFVSEPEGMDKPTGMDETTRHRMFGSLNPGVSIPPIRIQFKILKKYANAEIAMIYSCSSCGKVSDPQKITLPIRSIHLPQIQLVPKINLRSR